MQFAVKYDTNNFRWIDIDRMRTDTLIHLSQWNRLTRWTICRDVDIVQAFKRWA